MTFKSVPSSKAPAADPVFVSFFAREAAEVRDWIPCNISGKGTKPNTYNIAVPGKGGASQEIPDIPGQGLRKAQAKDRSASGEALVYAVGERAEVFGWTRCNIMARGTTPDTYDVRKLTAEGGQDLLGMPAARLRRIRGPGWLHYGDPALPVGEPGMDAGGICKGAQCAKMWGRCVAARRKSAEQNCGGRCDIVFVGDSILEELLGRKCYSGGRPFKDSARVYRELVLARHPKSLIIAGSGDETSQALYQLDTTLPVIKAPRLYFLMIGTNNIPKGGRAHALRGIRAVVERLHKEHPTTPILLHPILPRWDDGDYRFFQAHIDEVNAELPALVSTFRAGGAPIELVDCIGVLHQTEPRITEHFYDKLHLSAEGYRAWLACLAPTLDRVLAGASQ